MLLGCIVGHLTRQSFDNGFLETESYVCSICIRERSMRCYSVLNTLLHLSFDTRETKQSLLVMLSTNTKFSLRIFFSQESLLAYSCASRIGSVEHSCYFVEDLACCIVHRLGKFSYRERSYLTCRSDREMSSFVSLQIIIFCLWCGGNIGDQIDIVVATAHRQANGW